MIVPRHEIIAVDGIIHSVRRVPVRSSEVNLQQVDDDAVLLNRVPGPCKECLDRWSREKISGILLSQSRKYTMCDVRKHIDISDCWLVANNQVYDVTNFITHHPGGISAIVKRAGTDVSRDHAFHSPSARRQWRKYVIGELISCSAHQVPSYLPSCCVS